MKFFPSWTLISLVFSLSFLGCASFSEKQEKAQLHAKLGVSYFDSGNFPMALAEFLKAEKIDPDNAGVQNNLGLTYFMREKYALAEKHLRRSVELQPTFTDARNNLARVYIETGKHAEAHEELQKVLKDLTYTGFGKAYINLGLNYFNQKKYSQARDAFLKSIENQQDNCVANTYYGRSLLELKDFSRALIALDRAIGFCQNNLFDEPHYYSALTYYRMGEKEKSIIRFEETVKLYPNGRFQEKSRAMLDLIRKGQEE